MTLIFLLKILHITTLIFLLKSLHITPGWCTPERSEPKKFCRVSGTSFKRFLTRRRHFATARRLAIAAHLLRCRTCFNPHRSAATPAVKTGPAPCSCTTLASLTVSGRRRSDTTTRACGKKSDQHPACCVSRPLRLGFDHFFWHNDTIKLLL